MVLQNPTALFCFDSTIIDSMLFELKTATSEPSFTNRINPSRSMRISSASITSLLQFFVVTLYVIISV